MTQNKDFSTFLNNYIDDILQEHYHFDDKDFYQKKITEINTKADFLKSHPVKLERNNMSIVEYRQKLAEKRKQRRIDIEDRKVKEDIQLIHKYIEDNLWVFQYVTKSQTLATPNINFDVAKNGNHKAIVNSNNIVKEELLTSKPTYLMDSKEAALAIINFVKQFADKLYKNDHSHKKGCRHYSSSFLDNLRGKTSELATAILIDEPIDSLDLRIYKNKFDTDDGVDIQNNFQSNKYQVKSSLTVHSKSPFNFDFSINKKEFNDANKAGCKWIVTSNQLDMIYLSHNSMNLMMNYLLKLKRNQYSKKDSKINVKFDKVEIDTEYKLLKIKGHKVDDTYTFESNEELKKLFKLKKFNIILQKNFIDGDEKLWKVTTTPINNMTTISKSYGQLA